jgi:hypothetical protein
MAVAKRHRHKYYQLDMNGTFVWACALQDCNHYMPKHMEATVNGKMSYCWGCNDEINLNPANMKDKQPLCANCQLGIKPDDVEIVENAPLTDKLKAFLDGKL